MLSRTGEGRAGRCRPGFHPLPRTSSLGHEPPGSPPLTEDLDLPDLPVLGKDHGQRIVLGIDPGTRVVGYGALVQGKRGPSLLAAGVLRAPAQAPVPRRLARIRAAVDHLVHCLSPQVVVVEQAFASRNIQSALRIGEARGVVLASAAGAGAEVVEYSPSVAKKALVGRGGADKTQVAAMVSARLGLEEGGLALDATDALALAIAFLEREQLSARLGGARP